MSLYAGAQLGHYKITSGLGAGGMGEVYRAHDTQLGRDVAIKLLTENATDDSRAIERFTREARAASALNHPNIITIYEVGNVGTRRFIVMELVHGQPLRAMISKPPSVDLLASIGSQAAKALSVAHRAGIIHRDIKPENIMVREDGYVKVLDFGLARLAAPAAQSSADTRSLDETRTEPLTQSGLIVGTVKYMSPEQARGEIVSGATDVFSLGIVLYEMATTLHPFSVGSDIGTLQAITSDQPVAPSRLNPELSTELDSIILQMLEKEARRRPAASDVDRVLTAIAHSGSGRSISAARTKLPGRHSVGREKELRQARESFESVSVGRGLMLAVAGEPGIGKTTFVEDFIAELEASRTTFIVARGRCSERLAGAEAYLPLLEALDNSLRGEGSQWAARVMKQVAPTWFAQVFTALREGASDDGMPVGQLTQERMKREFGALLEEVSRLRPLILFIDDLHWADVSTIDMLAYLASKFDTMRVLIVVTYRPSDLLLVKHPFLQIKPEMVAHGTCREIRLEFLSREEIEVYLGLEFPTNRLPAELPALIHARTEGNPLFMSDLVRYLRDRTVIAKDNGDWVLAHSLAEVEREMPESVLGMIQRKIDQLSEDERHLLLAASVQGCDFDSAVIGRALSLESADVEERLEEMERVHALVKFVAEYEFPDRTLTLRYRFVHALYQNALYSSLRPSRRGSLSRSVAQALIGYYKDRNKEVAAELAHLFEAARDFSLAVDYYLAAAQNTAQVFAHTETQVLAGRGLELLKLLPESAERDGKELALHLALGGALSLTKGFATAEAGSSHARARELCHKMGDIPQLAPALFGLFVYYVVAGKLETARQVADQLLRVAQGAAEQTMLMVGYHAPGTVRLFLGDIVTSYEYLERALSFYEPEHHLTYVLRYRYDPSIDAMCHMSLILWLRGYRDQALQKIREALSLAQRANDPHSIAFAQTTLTSIFERGGEVQPTREWAERCIEHCDRHEIVENKLWVMCGLGWALARQGQSVEGIELIKKCIEVLRAQRAEISFPHLLVVLADALGEAGRIEEGLDVIAEAFEVIERTDERVCESEVYIMKGRLLIKRGGNENLSDTEKCFREAIDLARRQRAKIFELRATTNLSQLYEKSGRREEACRMLEDIYGWFSEGFDAPDLKEARALLDTLKDERGAS